MSILRSDNVIYYHPCDSVVDYNSVAWTNPNLWVPTGTFTSGLIDNSYHNGDMGVGGVYTNSNGASRITVCFWTYDQLSPARINVGFVNHAPEQYQIIQLDAVTDRVVLFAGGNTADVVWSGVVTQGSGWHFHVLDMERACGSWILRHSRDGSDWTSEPAEVGPDLHGIHSDSHIAGGDVTTTNAVDEVVLWRNARLFTSGELSNLYELFNTHGTTMDQYTNVFGITGFTEPLPDTYSAVSLYITGPSGVNCGIPLYMRCPEAASGSFDISIRGIIPATPSSDQTGKPFDWLIRTSDYYPQIVGTLLASSGVNIQVWDTTDGNNVLVDVSSSGCYDIGNTGRWGWSTSGLPLAQGHARQYFYMMTSDAGEKFDGQFVMDIPERAKWIHPDNQNDYIL
jgi:hypothetical protein